MTTTSTAELLDARPWSARRWAGMVFLAFAVQILLIWVIAKRPAPPPPSAVFATHFELIPPDWPAPGQDPGLLLSDPAVVPMPGRHGFSGDAWLHYHPIEHTFSPWNDRLEILGPAQERLGQALPNTLQHNPVTPLQVADVGLPEPAADKLVIPSLRPSNASWLEQTGALQNRPLLGKPALPSWPSNEILSLSEVRLALRADGTVLTATLLQSCGFPEADTHALAFALAARCQPLPLQNATTPPVPFSSPKGTAFGSLLFHWHTIPLSTPLNSATNGR